MKAIDLSEATLRIDSCGIYYQGNRLELGQSIAEWEQVLGKASKDTNLGKVWDNLGIAVDDWQNGDSTVFGLYIFFLNLESPEGQAGMLTMARGWKPFDESIYRTFDPNFPDLHFSEEEIAQLKKRKSPSNYLYPYHTYQGYVDLHGCPVAGGMKVEEINAYRQAKKIPYSGLFTYLDQDIDGINNSGVATKTFGGEYIAYGTECRKGRIMGYSLVFGYDATLEYLQLEREDSESYQIRKDREQNEQSQP